MSVLRALYKLVYPAKFLSIKHRDNAYFYYLFPAALTAMAVIIDNLVFNISLFGSSGVVRNFNGLIGILVGFYIAALAAVSTFNKPGMDELMKGDPPVLARIELTRRQYLSMLFGYLALLSIVVFVVGVIGETANVDAVVLLGKWSSVGRAVFFVSYFFMFFNLMCTTLLGLYFLSYRIHKDEIEIERD